MFDIQRAAMAGLVVLVAIAGFMIGGGLGESVAQQRFGSDVQVSAPTTTTTSNELTDLFSDGI